MKAKKSKKFEENYFQGWFKHAVGSFSASDLEKSKNWFWSWLKKLNQYLPIEVGKGRSVLEIGCSIGAVANLLSERGFNVWASDISELAVKKASKLTPQVHFFQLNIEKKISLKKKFDIIIAFEVVEHLHNPEQGIKNMVSLLKKDGTLVLSTPYPYWWNFRDPTHINVKYPEDWVIYMGKAGLKNVRYHRFSLLPFVYKFNKRFQFTFPFPIPNKYINSPIFFIGRK